VGVYALKRVLWAGVLFFGLSTVTFVIFFLLPHVDPARRRRRIGFAPPSPLDVDQHQSVAHEYGQFMSNVVHGDLGHSTASGHDVLTVLTTVTPATAGLVLGGAVIWMLIAIPLGLGSALRPRSRAARGLRALFVVGMSASPLWLGLLLSWFFGVYLGWLPPGGYCDALGPGPDCGGPIPWTQHMVLPWTAFALLFAGVYVRMIRANAIDVLQEGHVRTARAKGVGDWTLLRSHVFAASVRPVLTALVLDIGGLAIGAFVGATIFVEEAFGINGLGRAIAQSAQRRDFPMLAGAILFVAALVAVVNVVADLLAYLTDPRERPARRKHSRAAIRSADADADARPRSEVPVVEHA
jgi:peptide/nickel transport system permease protein